MAGQRAVRTPASLGAHTVTVHTWNTHRAGLRRVQCGHPRMPIHKGVQGWGKHHCCREHWTEMTPDLKHTYHRPQTQTQTQSHSNVNEYPEFPPMLPRRKYFHWIDFFFFNRREHREARGLCLLKAKFIKKKKKKTIDFLFIPPTHSLLLQRNEQRVQRSDKTQND